MRCRAREPVEHCVQRDAPTADASIDRAFARQFERGAHGMASASPGNDRDGARGATFGSSHRLVAGLGADDPPTPRE